MSENESPAAARRYSNPWYSKPGVVYFIVAGDPALAVKIGVSTDDALDERVRTIQGSNHERIAVRAVIPFTKDDYTLPMLAAEKREQALHQQFRTYCRSKPWHPGHEWFDAAHDLMQFVTDELREGRALSLEEWRRRTTPPYSAASDY